MSRFGADRYRGSSRESYHSTGSPIFGDIVRAIKDLPQALRTALVIDEVVTSCRCCQRPLRWSEEFCNQECGLRYWESLRQRRGKMSGNSVGVFWAYSASQCVNSIMSSMHLLGNCIIHVLCPDGETSCSVLSKLQVNCVE